MSGADAALGELLAREQIREVIHRRARASDRRDVELARTCYARGATEDHEGFRGSAEDYMAQSQISDAARVPVMYHFVGNILIDVDLESGTAAAETYVVAIGELAGDVDRDVIVAARYLDELVDEAGAWRIRHRQMVLDWSRVESRGARYWDVLGLDRERLPFGHPGGDDPSYRLFARGA